METAIVVGVLGALAALAALRRPRREPASLPAPPAPPAPGPAPTPPSPPPVASVDPWHQVDPPAGPTASAPTGVPTLGMWSALLVGPCLSARPAIQLAFAVKWIDMESGGNPCAIGYPPAAGPDGEPLELGIVQLYNPDDLQGASGHALRAYCVPGRNHETIYKNRKVVGFSQGLTRDLTPDEAAQQAHLAVGLIQRCARDATRDLVAVHAGPAWSPEGRDFWTLVKLQHALPVISRSGLPAVTKKLGRPPKNWQEFRATLAGVQFDPDTEKKYRSDFPRLLNNAEECASAFSPTQVVA